MTPDPDASDSHRKSGRFDPALAEIKARPMGELVRGTSHWDVVLEIAKDPSVGAVRGRIHFVGGNVHRLSGWIFLEWSEAELEARFQEFAAAAQQLWNLLDSLAP